MELSFPYSDLCNYQGLDWTREEICPVQTVCQWESKSWYIKLKLQKLICVSTGTSITNALSYLSKLFWKEGYDWQFLRQDSFLRKTSVLLLSALVKGYLIEIISKVRLPFSFLQYAKRKKCFKRIRKNKKWINKKDIHYRMTFVPMNERKKKCT